jgi:hypothetical protein
MYNKNKKKLENQIINRLTQFIERELRRTVAVHFVKRKKARYADILCFQVIGVCEREIPDLICWDLMVQLVSKEFGVVLELYVPEDHYDDIFAA